jgi:hypothetical protein
MLKSGDTLQIYTAENASEQPTQRLSYPVLFCEPGALFPEIPNNHTLDFVYMRHCFPGAGPRVFLE